MLQPQDLLADILKSGEDIHHLKTIGFGQPIDHGGRHNCLDHNGILGHGTQLDAGAGDVIGQQHADLVSGQKQIAARMRYCNAHTVAVRVGGQQQIRLVGFTQIQALLQRFPDFRIGIGAGGEVAVRQFLLLHRDDIPDTDAVENRPHAHISGAV